MSQKSRHSGKEAPFPSKADILRFIEESPDNIGKREIARAFHIRGDDRKKLKTVLREMADDGLIQRGHNRSVERAGQLPAVTVIEINETDIDGELMARPDKWEEETPPPPIIVIPDRKQGRGLGGTFSGRGHEAIGGAKGSDTNVSSDAGSST